MFWAANDSDDRMAIVTKRYIGFIVKIIWCYLVLSATRIWRACLIVMLNYTSFIVANLTLLFRLLITQKCNSLILRLIYTLLCNITDVSYDAARRG